MGVGSCVRHRTMSESSRFRVWGLGLRVLTYPGVRDLGFRVYKFRVQGSGFRVQGSGRRAKPLSPRHPPQSRRRGTHRKAWSGV